ncbi:MAG: metallophosphoesterase family protein [Pikeienuella sp.]
MVMLSDAGLPDGLRIYAIGDVHGCLDQLEAVARSVRSDLLARPVDDWRVVLLGDYIDRGADSLGVLRWLSGAGHALRLHPLLGNHDAMLLDALASPDPTTLLNWLVSGGRATLESCGIGEPEIAAASAEAGRQHLRMRLAEVLGPELHAWLRKLPLSARFGDYLFVHAGVRPRVALDAQAAEDLLWIRGEFLTSQEDLGAVVVHGHSPRPEIELRPNRIAIDTGAVFGGRLSCLILEGHSRARLEPDGPVPLDAAG